MKPLRVLILTAVAITSLGLFAVPAQAAPRAQKPVVHQCDPGCNERVSEGETVTKRISIDVQASGSDLSAVELQLSLGTGDYFCIERWSASGRSLYKPGRIWDTRAIPDGGERGCRPSDNHNDGAPWGRMTENQSVRLRVYAVGGQLDPGSDSSEPFLFSLSNAPSAPTWAGSPREIGDRTKNVRVQLRWMASSDPAVAEYRVVRTGPDGERTFAVKASRPGAQGCEGGSVVTCYDDRFGETYKGTYHYTLYAFRGTDASTSESGVSPCQATSGNCITSQGSDTKSASFAGPPTPSPETTPKPKPTQSAGPSSPSPTTGNPSPSPTKTAAELRAERQRARVLAEQRRRDYLDFFTGDYDETLPFDERGGFLGSNGPVYGGIEGDNDQVAIGPNAFPVGRDPTPYRAAAGGLLMILVASHMARLLKRSYQ